jgi:hypothetical protein
MRRGRLMLAPLLTATSGAAWAAPESLEGAADLPRLPPLPPPPDAAATPATIAVQTQPVSLFIMRPMLDGTRLDQVTAEFNIIELRAIEAGSLERALGNRLPAAQRAELHRETGRFLPVARLQELGIIATYDPSNLTLNLALVPEAVGARIASFSADGDRPGSRWRKAKGQALFGGLVDWAGRVVRNAGRSRLIPAPDAAKPALPPLAGVPEAGLPLVADTAGGDVPPILPDTPASGTALAPAPSPSPIPAPPPVASDPRAERVSRITMYPLLDGNRLALVTAELTLSELRAIEADSLERALGGAARRIAARVGAVPARDAASGTGHHRHL